MKNPTFLVPFTLDHSNDILSMVAHDSIGIEIDDFREPSAYNTLNHYLKIRERVAKVLAPITCIKTLHAPYRDISLFSEDKKIATRSLALIRQALETASILSCTKIVIHTGFTPINNNAEIEKESARRLTTILCQLAREYPQLILCIENSYENSFLLFEELFNSTLPSNIKMCLDTGHAHIYGTQTTEELITRFVQHISHIHIHDNHGSIDEHQLPGEGTINWQRVSAAISTLPSPTLLFEVFKPLILQKNIRDLKQLFIRTKES